MNELLNFTGAILYMAISIVLLPVFFLFDLFMGCWLVLRFLSRLGHGLQVKVASHRYPWQFKKALQALRFKHA